MGFADSDDPKTLDERNPVDGVVRNLIDEIHDRGRGFALGVASAGADGSKTISVVESLKPHDEWEPPAAYRDHAINDTDSFIAYARKYGTAGNSLVLVAAEKSTLVIDETVARGQRETVDMVLLASDDWREWNDVLGKPMSHRDLFMFLVRHERNLPDASILTRFSKMTAKAEVDHNSDIMQYGAGEIGFKFKTTAGDELAKFPTTFGIELPVLDQDVGDLSGIPSQKIQIRLQIEMPTAPGKGVTFTLLAPEWKQTMTRRVRLEIEKIRKELDGWTVVHGRFNVEPRKLPA